MKRLENKYLINDVNAYNKFLKFIFKNSFREIYKKRKINSIYFDYDNLKLYDLSEEGVASKDKIRLRYYGEEYDIKNTNLEIKNSNAYSKNKYVSNFLEPESNCDRKIIFAKNEIFSKKLKPKVKVSYNRRYFFSEEHGRLTIDENIIYEKVNFNNNYRKINLSNKSIEKRRVCEHKIENQTCSEYFIPISNIRFSKYCEAIKRVFLNY